MIPEFFKKIFGEELTPEALAMRIKSFNKELNSNPEVAKKFNELIRLEQQLTNITEKYNAVREELAKILIRSARNE